MFLVLNSESDFDGDVVCVVKDLDEGGVEIVVVVIRSNILLRRSQGL